jgi:aminomethyltransferase
MNDGWGERPMNRPETRRTPLHDEHLASGGKMVPFAGFEMPIQYTAGITAEHNAVRTAAGLFDVSHMGEFDVAGPQALDLVQFVTTNDASRLEIGQAQYSTLPNEAGTLLDDLIVYRFEDRYMLVVNAANRAKDFQWISRWAERFDVRLTDRSDETALLALQGPRATEVLERLTSEDLDSIGYYRFAPGQVAGREVVLSRTGYTGEDGWELYLAPDAAPEVWSAILEAGRDDGVLPAGLGARDSLRLEMGYPLYGNDLDESRSPLQAGLGWVTKLDKGEFIGRTALQREKEEGIRQKLVGFRLRERGFPRQGYPVASRGEVVGSVTSGTLSPSLGTGIGMGYVPVELAKPGTELEIVIRNQNIPAEVVRPPFYTEGSIRR